MRPSTAPFSDMSLTLLRCTGAGHKAAHNIYIWDRETGTLVKILEGPKDPCEDLDVRYTFS